MSFCDHYLSSINFTCDHEKHVFKGLWNCSCKNFVSLHLRAGIHLDAAVYFSNPISCQLLLSFSTASCSSPPTLKSKLLLAAGCTRNISELQRVGVQPPRHTALPDWFTETVLTMAVLGPIKILKGGDYRERMAQAFSWEFLCTPEESEFHRMARSAINHIFLDCGM